jgi:hypothetical protein
MSKMILETERLVLREITFDIAGRPDRPPPPIKSLAMNKITFSIFQIFWMENDLGYGVAVTADELARSFAGNWPRLVFLSGCKTAQSSELGLLPSFCEALVAAGAPAVLGWALPVRDDYATEAAAELYKHLAAGKRIDEAVARARMHLLEQNIPDWHLLRLYADRTPPAEVVTSPKTLGRQRIALREARAEFLDENARSEVCPRGEFVGRRRPLQRGLRTLTSRQRDPHYAEGVLLSGWADSAKARWPRDCANGCPVIAAWSGTRRLTNSPSPRSWATNWPTSRSI